MYHHYKPLRNFSAKLHITKSLADIWQLFQNLERDLALPADFGLLNNGKASIKDIIHPWELDILTREVILNAGTKEHKNLLKRKDIATAINLIRKIVDEQSNEDLENTIFHEMHRIVQQQFPWQKNFKLTLSRYLNIYKSPEIEEVLLRNTGLSTSQFYLLGIALSGHFIKSPFYNTNQSYKEFGISEHQKKLFLDRMIFGLDALKERTRSIQEYNQNWSFTINPLVKTPLIQAHTNAPHIVTCPIPRHLMTRFSEGLFFDMAEAKGFEQPYGNAFENYIGKISKQLINKDKISIERGKPYSIKKQEKHGVDWYLFDESSALLLECKTKGLKLKARYEINDTALKEEIEILAKSIVQNYKNMIDIIDNRTEWKPQNRKLYPITVTLSDWFLFAPQVFEQLEGSVLKRLKESNLQESLIKENPYTVMSAQEFETLIQVMNQAGLTEVIRNKSSNEYKNWMTMPLITSKYREELSNCKYDYLDSTLNELVNEFTETLHKNKARI